MRSVVFLEKARAQARETQRRRRQSPEQKQREAEYGKDYRQRPETKARAAERARGYHDTLKSDPDALAESNARHLRLWHERRQDPEIVKEQNRKAAERRKRRWREDPEYRAKVNAKQPERHRRRRERLREKLLEQQDGRCGNPVKCNWKGCGRDLTNLDSDEIQIDHIVPVARGGSDHVSNLQVLCKPCNIAARDRIPDGTQIAF